MNLGTAQALLIYMMVSSFTPGPGNILALNTVTLHGWQRGRRLIVGICTGYYGVQALCALAVVGLDHVLHRAMGYLPCIGAAYLVWLTVHVIRSRPAGEAGRNRPSFWLGFLLQFVNVKIYLYGITALTGYAVPFYPAWWQLLLLSAVIATLGSAATLTWAFAGVKMQAFYGRHYRPINWVLGLFLLYCAWSMVA